MAKAEDAPGPSASDASGHDENVAPRLPMRRSGFPMQPSYEDLSQYYSDEDADPATVSPPRHGSLRDKKANKHRDKPLPPAPLVTAENRSRSLPRLSKRLSGPRPQPPQLVRRKSIKVDIPSFSRAPQAKTPLHAKTPLQLEVFVKPDANGANESNEGGEDWRQSVDFGQDIDLNLEPSDGRGRRARSVMNATTRTPLTESGGSLPRSLTRQSNPTRRRQASIHLILQSDEDDSDSRRMRFQPWKWTVSLFTFWAPPLIRRFNPELASPPVMQAWREKVSLCMIIAMMCGVLGFITYGFTSTACRVDNGWVDFPQLNDPRVFDGWAVGGTVYRGGAKLGWGELRGDVTHRFGIQPEAVSTCQGVLKANSASLTQLQPTCASLSGCFPYTALTQAIAKGDVEIVGRVRIDWEHVHNSSRKLLVYGHRVLDVGLGARVEDSLFTPWTRTLFTTQVHRDTSKALSGTPYRQELAVCLTRLYTVGYLPLRSAGCLLTDVVLYVSLVVILGVVLVRFVMAVYFDWMIEGKLGKLREENEENLKRGGERREVLESGVYPFPMVPESRKGSVVGKPADEMRVTADEAREQARQLEQQLQQHLQPQQEHASAMTVSLPSRELASSTGSHSRRSPYGLELYSILLVTAYSEDSSGLRTTMSSLAATQYSDDHKLMVIIADGIITGSGNSKSTPELILEMLELDESWPAEPSPMLYQSISGSNEAKVYVAWYRNEGRCIPTLLIVKCGLDKERTALKPGNRGKRDSQLLLMAFLQRCLFNTPFSPLDYDLFQKSHYLMGVTPDKFEIILMVDADTKVAPDSLPRMVASMASDPTIMGLCGETRIANKNQSWVTRIQVFEYYLSHHLAKAFESVFGGVTCLPGCFCMYRIKAPKYIPSKKETQWVPILVHPEILQSYSTSHVSTLHKKNLLLLGEDRFLTTLMLSTFPQRKQIFVPRAYCKTVVPDTFKVLLSQRRRWINSTIHNLLELICVKELCGVLCLSMRFVVALELVGTVVLPAAIFFTFLLIIFSIIGPTEVIPLVLLGAILGLPAFLIVMTSRRYSYIYYMGVYLLALPVWNFVLPVYSFWHFDDFSWGQTRKVEGAGDERKGHADDQDDVVDEVPFRMWTAWEVERRRAIWGEWMKMKEQGLVKEGGTEGEKAEGDGDSAHGRSSLETVSDASTTV